MTPLKCGQCLMDFIQTDLKTVESNCNGENDLENIERATLIYNRHLQHLHLIAGHHYTALEPHENDKENYLHTLIDHEDSVKYQLYLEHSNTCPNRAYRVMC